MAVFETSADYFRFFANESRRGGSPLYERLSLGIAGDPAVQQLAAGRQKGQPAANLILAAVHYLLLSGIDDPLKEYYPSVGGTRAADDRAYQLFSAFCRAHAADLVEIVAKRVTNTNEVARSALLLPAFDLIAKQTNAPLGLIEIGCSAGLNLNFDRYGYRYMDENGVARLERWTNSSLVVSCNLQGPGIPSVGAVVPRVSSRVGLELAPPSITSEKERRWLRALVWPERTDRLANLDGALKIAALYPAKIKGGDAVANLASAVAAIPADEARCVYHTVMAYQLSGAQLRSIHQTLLDASQATPLWRVTVEGEVSGPNPLETFTPLKVTRYLKGERRTISLGVCDPHGRWLEWKRN